MLNLSISLPLIRREGRARIQPVKASRTSSKGARVRFDGAKRTLIDAPFTETKELVSRKVEQRELGRIVQVPEVGRFHHRYESRGA